MTRNKVWGNEYRTTMVCVGSYENRIPIGRMYNPYLDSGKSFCGLTQFLTEMEDLLDHMNCPQSFTAVRTFAPLPKLSATQADTETRKGKQATFAIKVLFRQNASWQGSVTWVESGQEQPFRSVLELIFLMNSALTQAD